MVYKATGERAEAFTAAVDDKGPPRQPHKQAPTTQTFRANSGANLEGAVAGPPWPSTHLMKPHPAARGLAGYRGAMALRLRAGRRQRAAAIPPPRERYLHIFWILLGSHETVTIGGTTRVRTNYLVNHRYIHVPWVHTVLPSIP